ncbi:MAG: hypothetical protein COA79_07395 [Planctomycetota bacterium]|nr:MAG: hypothetical protein COA79_07395 [Planctomycetota bacterium]
MTEEVNHDLLVSFEPNDIPGLVSFWDFQNSSDHFIANQGEPYNLQSQSGELNVIEDSSAPHGGKALDVKEGQWLNIQRHECPKLNIHGQEGHLTVVAWIKRQKTLVNQCEFIAGQWNESQTGRQYGLFLNISVWGQHHQICGHLSNVGGPTPGYKYCIDGAMAKTEIACNEWVTIAMSYDGNSGYAWLNGVLDTRPGLNPYSMAGGLHDGGKSGSDFTVGAVDRSGKIGNFFCGQIAGLAVYERALTPAELFALSRK